MNNNRLLVLTAPGLLLSLALALTAVGKPAAFEQSGTGTPAAASGTVAQAAEAKASTRVLEVSVSAVTVTDADALDKATAEAIAQRDDAINRLGCINSSVAPVAADPRGGPASVVRATVWESVEHAEAAALAADTGAPTSASSSSFRLLRETTISDDVAGHLEVVIFRTKPGVTREANLALFDKGEADYVELGKDDGGLLSHSLWIAPDGRWIHLLYWRSEADYAKTGKALFARPGVGGWIRSLDFKRFTVYRGDIADTGKSDAASNLEQTPTK